MKKTMIIQNNTSFRTLLVFGCFLVCGVFGCQTPSSGSKNPMFSSPMFAPSATIPPPATGSYTVGDAVAYANPGSGQQHHQPQPSYPPPGPSEEDNNDNYQDSEGAQPFRHSEPSPYSASSAQPPLVPAVENTSPGQWTQSDSQLADSQPSAQPFQTQYAGSVAPGSALMSAPEVAGPIEIPTSAYRTDSGMRVSSEAALANTRGSSSVTQTAFVVPATTRQLPDSQSPGLTQPGPVYAEKVE